MSSGKFSSGKAVRGNAINTAKAKPSLQIDGSPASKRKASHEHQIKSREQAARAPPRRVASSTIASPQRAPSVKGKGTAPTAGTGKKRKVFAETAGIDHLVALSNKIATQHEDRIQQRVDRAHEKQAWAKGKRKGAHQKAQEDEDAARKQESGKERVASKGNVDTVPTSGAKKGSLVTKASARANLVAKTREKAKMRKELRRRAEAARGKEKQGAEQKESRQRHNDRREETEAPRKKRVSFV